MSFGLKTAPSMFQKAMVQIFASMTKNMLIYIDDFPVFSEDETSYMNYLRQFHNLLLQHDDHAFQNEVYLFFIKDWIFRDDNLKMSYELQSHIAK